MHRAYYRKHREEHGALVNILDREVPNVAWSGGMKAFISAIAMDQLLLGELDCVLDIVEKDNAAAVDKWRHVIPESAESFLDKIALNPVHIFEGCLSVIECILLGCMGLGETDLDAESVRQQILILWEMNLPIMEKVYHWEDENVSQYKNCHATLESIEGYRENAVLLVSRSAI